MIYDVMRFTNNYFYIHDSRGRVVTDGGEFTIADGIIKPITVNIQAGQYIKIIGSIFNDSVFKVERLVDGYIDVSIIDADYPIWVQPTELLDSFNIGDGVTHDGIKYESLINANMYVPGTDARWWEKVDAVEHSLQDEVFTGMVIPLAVPRAFIELYNEIEVFRATELANPNSMRLKSETFAGYSYSVATNEDGTPVTWQSVFASRLNNYKKMFPEKI